jgi:transposase
MPKRGGSIHVVTTTRSYKGKVYKTHLLRRSFREGDKVRNETVGNISHLPEPVVGLVREALRGQTFVPSQAAFEIRSSLPHGHVQAVLAAMDRLGMAELLSSTESAERRVVLGMIASRILGPMSKLATTRLWKTMTLADELGLRDATEDDLYAAMDWLHARQARIEGKLAARHLKNGDLVLYDVTSTYFEGRTCPLAAYGHDRDKKGKPQIVVGLLTADDGCPVSAEAFKGNTADPKTLPSQIKKVLERFSLKQVVMVGDRGMITEARIREDLMPEVDHIKWVTALRSEAIRRLLDAKAIDRSLFDERNLVEIRSGYYPDERLVVCRNPLLADERAKKREELIRATELELEKIRAATQREKNPLRGKAQIGIRVGKVLFRHKVGKHFRLKISSKSFEFQRRFENIEREKELDGIYVIRTSVPKAQLSAGDVVRTYKKLSRVERAFRNLKTVQLHIRPIYHSLAPRVRAHVFLCMLAYYVEWHMEEAWRPILFADEDQAAKARRDPVAPAGRSRRALVKDETKVLPDGSPVHSFRTLLKDLSSIVRNTCTPKGAAASATFELTTIPTPEQRRALDLIAKIAL